MKITVRNNTGDMVLVAENEQDVMKLGRISSRLRNRPKPTKYGESYELTVGIGEVIDLLSE